MANCKRIDCPGCGKSVAITTASTISTHKDRLGELCPSKVVPLQAPPKTLESDAQANAVFPAAVKAHVKALADHAAQPHAPRRPGPDIVRTRRTSGRAHLPKIAHRQTLLELLGSSCWGVAGGFERAIASQVIGMIYLVVARCQASRVRQQSTQGG